MKSKIAKRIMKDTPQKTKDFVRDYAQKKIKEANEKTRHNSLQEKGQEERQGSQDKAVQ
jgi:hypothetical protein